MKRSAFLWSLMGFAVTSFLGTLLHFLYEWTGESTWSALISGVNESTWEHMKLLFVPMLLYATVQSFFWRDREDYWCIKLRGSLLGLALIPVLFYTYNGVIGTSPDWINIAIFFVAAGVAYCYEWRRLRQEGAPCRWARPSFAILCGIAALFVLFTFATPHLGIFQDPITGGYGLNG